VRRVRGGPSSAVARRASSRARSTARCGSGRKPEMAPQWLEMIESVPENGAGGTCRGKVISGKNTSPTQIGRSAAFASTSLLPKFAARNRYRRKCTDPTVQGSFFSVKDAGNTTDSRTLFILLGAVTTIVEDRTPKYRTEKPCLV